MKLSLALSPIAVALRKRRDRGVAPPFALADGQWAISERPEDANARQVQVDIYRDPPAGLKYVWYRGKAAFAVPTSGSFGASTDLDGGHWRGQAAGKTTMGTVDMVRVFLAPVGLSDPVAWNAEGVIPCVPVDGIKSFFPSSVPGNPVIASYEPDGTGGADITFETAVTNGRTVTGGSYRIGTSGSYTGFTGLTLNIPAIDDGQTVQVYWTNVNGNSPVLSQVLYLLAAPPPPEATYIIDGSGTNATVLLSPPEGFDTSDLIGARWQIDVGAWTEQSEVFEIALTGLSGTPEVGVAWQNAAGWSETTTFTLVVSPPTYDDFTVEDAVAETGDELTLTLGTAPAVPDGLAVLDIEYTTDGGMTSVQIVGNPTDMTGFPTGDEVDVQTRIIYNVGPSPWSAPVSATPTQPALVTEFALDTDWVITSSGGTSVASMGVTLPTRPVGQIIFGFVSVNRPNGGPTTDITLTKDPRPGTNDWVLHQDGAGQYASLWTFYKVCQYTDETLTIVSASSEQMLAKCKVIDGGRFADIVRGANVAGQDPGAISWAEVEKALLLVANAWGAAATSTSAAPDGWENYSKTSTSTTSAGCSLAVATLDSESNGVDPGPFIDGSPTLSRSVVYAILPVTSIPPVTVVSVDVSAESIDNGQIVTFVAQADGRAPITYGLEIDGVTYTEVANNNLPVSFDVMPTTGTQDWVLTATNAAGSADDTGSIIVRENLIFTASETDELVLQVQADSVPHSVTPASYELEWGNADGTGATVLSQIDPDFDLTMTTHGAIRFRVRGIDAGSNPGDWSDYKYYWTIKQDKITWRGENAAEVGIGHLSEQDVVCVVPVPTRQVSLYEVWPQIATEVAGGVTYHLNGCVINPSAYSGRGPQGWDSRTGGSDGLRGLHSRFDVSRLQTEWPVSLDLWGTAKKCASRPTAQLASGTQGYRSGLLDQHGGLVVCDALPTLSPLQAAPSIIKESAWTGGLIDLPGYDDLLAQIVALDYSIDGMTPVDSTLIADRLCRFDPSNKVMRGGTYWTDDSEPFRPFRSATSTLSNYYSNFLDDQAICLLMSDAVSSDWKQRVLNHFILRGIQWNFPGNDFRIGAGISQDFLPAFMLAQLARGEDFLLAAVSQREIRPNQFGYWNSTTVTWLEPHDDPTRPLFARRRQILAVSADATGHILTVGYSASNGTGEGKQRFEGLEIYRESTGETLVHRADNDRDSPTADLKTVGFFSTTPTVGEWIYMRIPPAQMANFVPGEPFWMYGTYSDGSWEWFTFNPTVHMSYRSIVEGAGCNMLGRALNVWPTTAGSSWKAMEDYNIKARQTGWPGTGSFDYSFTSSGLVSDFWGAHAATLGITL